MKREFIKPLLAVIAMSMFIYALYLLFQKESFPEISKDAVMILLGCITMIVKDVYGYYFGSSEGSAKKSETIDNMNKPLVKAEESK